MGLFEGLRRLFRSTDEVPPPAPAGFHPVGLEAPDPPDELQVINVSIGPANENIAPIGEDTVRHTLDGIRITVTYADSQQLEELEAAYQKTKDERSIKKQQPPKRKPLRFIAEDVFGITFMIEYRDSQGTESRRRISMRGLHVDDVGTIYISALCHERHAIRTFRFDRVLSVIDSDGVVHEPEAFFLNELRINIREASTIPDKADSLSPVPEPKTVSSSTTPGRAHRRLARDGLRILCAVSRSDYDMHSEEVEIILRYIVAEANDKGLPTSSDDIEALKAYVRRQRPSQDVLDACISRMETENRERQKRLMRAVIEVIDADGSQHEAEFLIAQDIQQRLG